MDCMQLISVCDIIFQVVTLINLITKNIKLCSLRSVKRNLRKCLVSFFCNITFHLVMYCNNVGTGSKIYTVLFFLVSWQILWQTVHAYWHACQKLHICQCIAHFSLEPKTKHDRFQREREKSTVYTCMCQWLPT